MMMRFQRRQRTSFTRDQLDTLHEAFKRSHYPEAKERNELARLTNLEPTRIQVWFQNQRAKDKKRKSIAPFSSTSTSSFDDQSTPSPPINQQLHHHRQLIKQQLPHAPRNRQPSQTHPVIFKDNPLHHLTEPSPATPSGGQPRFVYVFSSATANEAAEAVRQGEHSTILQYHERKYSNQQLATVYDSGNGCKY